MRKSGILMHISSLPGKCGIGKLGKEAYEFVDFLEKSGQKIWQVLPLSPTSYGDSPYQSFSIYAGNPYFIDFDTLKEEGLLKEEEYSGIDWGNDPAKVDFGKIYQNIWGVLKKAHKRFRKNPDKGYTRFVVKNKDWIFEYGTFMAIKFANKGKPWYEWEDSLRMHKSKAVKAAGKKYSNDIDFWCFVQYKFFSQWEKLKKHANSKGIEIIGDIPIYCAYDSVEVWAHPEYFYLDKNKKPVDVAGCPPDAFSADGQLWGNPLYRWDYMAKEKYRWWIDRIAAAQNLYDIIRIDHFRGFESYYSIPYGSKNAKKGEWKKGPDLKLFKEVKRKLGDVKIIAEDLGFLTKKVTKMLEGSGYPGMKVLEFAFDGDAENVYLPHNYKNSNNICYTGTHDNDTLAGWLENCDESTRKYCEDYTNTNSTEETVWALIRLAWSGISETAVAQMQDILCLGSEARMNTPSTLGENWQWRMEDFSAIDDALTEKLRNITYTFGRNKAVKKEEKSDKK